MRVVPESRLLWAAGLLVPLALLAPLTGAGGLLLAAGVVALVVVAILDLLLSQGREATVEVALPPVVRLTVNRQEALPLSFNAVRSGVKRFRYGLVLPEEAGTQQETMTVELTGEMGKAKSEWRCLPRRRGRYVLESVHLEMPSALGFWGLRTTRRLTAEIRVYPNLWAERKDVAALFLNRGLYGAHAVRQVGRGREFERLREYLPGDSYEDIHWKASARRASPITKVFQVERTQEVYVIVDSSRLSARVPALGEGDQTVGETGKWPLTLLERYVTATLILAVAAERQGDHFGLLTYGAGVERFVRAGSGKSHFNVCRDALYTLQTSPVAPDLATVFAFLRSRLRKRALLIFLTSLDDPVLDEVFLKNINLLSRQHLVLVNMLRPSGVGRLFEGAPPRDADGVYERLGGHLRWRELKEAGRRLQRLGVRLSLLENEKMMASLVSQYMEVKQRQIL